ncbi:MAG TPA: universal stress protein [Thermohalobaculum sp.]|nr:universal stress protein [Thermohalobaculum sp.]
MSIKTILAVIAEGTDAEATLAPAIALAERHGAHLAALAITELPAADYGYGYGSYGGVATGQFLVERMEEARERVEALAERLRQRLAGPGISAEVRTAARSLAGVAHEVAHHGRYADLVMMARAGEEGTETQQRAFDGALFDSGRGVALTPAGWADAFGERIAVAWDGSRPAARAIAAAMPLIEGAREVRVALVEPKVSDEDHGPEPGADLGAALARHNPNVTVDRLPSLDRPVAKSLLEHAHDAGADLIVLGAYGHSRFAEAVFGGVTRDMLRDASLPLLMAH